MAGGVQAPLYYNPFSKGKEVAVAFPTRYALHALVKRYPLQAIRFTITLNPKRYTL